MFKLVKILVAICFAALISSAQASPEEINKFNVGDVSITAIVDTTFELTSALIKNADTNIIKKCLPEGKITVSVNAYIAKTRNQTILIDAGTGARLLSNMKEAGFSPDSISLVLITHGHFDHIGGLLKDGKPVFVNAKILMSEKEYALYSDSSIATLPADIKQYFMLCNQVLKVYGKSVQTFKEGTKINDCISAYDIKGHTAGQTAYMVESKGKKLLLAGDFLHIAPVQFPHPEYCLAFDADVNMAVSARKQVMDKVSREKILVAGVHIKFPGIGTIANDKGSFVFTPVK